MIGFQAFARKRRELLRNMGITVPKLRTERAEIFHGLKVHINVIDDIVDELFIGIIAAAQ